MAQTIDRLEQIHIGKKGAAPIAAPGWTGKSKERMAEQQAELDAMTG